MSYGYNRVTTLPINASSIVISQSVGHIDENYLAIKDSKGEYLFNGNYIVMMYSMVLDRKHGPTIEFSGSEQVEETISIADAITEELTVEVGLNSHDTYTYLYFGCSMQLDSKYRL